MENVPLPKKHKVAYTIVERNNRKFWLRVGAAFTNRDGSMNVHLDAVPTNGQLHIRDYRPLEEVRTRDPYETRSPYEMDKSRFDATENDSTELAAG